MKSDLMWVVIWGDVRGLDMILLCMLEPLCVPGLVDGLGVHRG